MKFFSLTVVACLIAALAFAGEKKGSEALVREKNTRGAEPHRKGKSTWATPELTFAALQKAVKDKDFSRLLERLTPDSQDTLVGGMVESLRLSTLLAKDFKMAVRPEVQAVIDKHKLDLSKDIKPGDYSAAAGMVREKAKFVEDVAKVYEALGRKHWVSALETAELSNVRAEGDRGTGQVSFPKVPRAGKVPIDFRKIDGKWRVNIRLSGKGTGTKAREVGGNSKSPKHKDIAQVAAVRSMSALLQKGEFVKFYKDWGHPHLQKQLTAEKFAAGMKKDRGKHTLQLFADVIKMIDEKAGKDQFLAQKQESGDEYEFVLVKLKDMSRDERKGRQWHIELKLHEGKWKVMDVD